MARTTLTLKTEIQSWRFDYGRATGAYAINVLRLRALTRRSMTREDRLGEAAIKGHGYIVTESGTLI